MKALLSLVVLTILLVGSVDVVMAVSSTHPLILQWGESGKGNSQFYNPQNLATDSDGNICALQKGGNDGFSIDEILRCGEISIKVGSIIREKLKQISGGNR